MASVEEVLGSECVTSGGPALSLARPRVPNIQHGPGHREAAPVQDAAPEDDGQPRVLELSLRRQAVLGANIADKMGSLLLARESEIPTFGAV